jgi:hypothetical protein
MKYVKIFIFILYLFVYGYSTYKTSVAPNETIWAYICVFVFPFIFYWLASYFINKPEKKSQDLEAN